MPLKGIVAIRKCDFCQFHSQTELVRKAEIVATKNFTCKDAFLEYLNTSKPVNCDVNPGNANQTFILVKN